jgi:sec-independent protein translocase protein TatA
MPGWPEMVVIAIVGLLIFGRRLPEVGRSLGRSIVEFKRGVREAKDQIDQDAALPDSKPTRLPPSQPQAPKTVESNTASQPSENTNP